MQLLLIQLAFFLTTVSHPFFISICQIHHNAEAKTLEMAVKIFADDLETALEAQGTKALRLGTSQEAPGADAAIAAYLDRQITIKVNGQELKGKFIGKELEMDVIWCYVEFPGVSDPRQIDISNRLLMEQFSTQTNIVHITVNHTRKSLLMQAGRTEDSVIF